MAVATRPTLRPIYCGGCGIQLFLADTALGSFHIVQPVAEIRISVEGGWAEIICPDPRCRSYNRLEAQRPRQDRAAGHH